MLGEPVRDRRTERHEATKAEIVDAAWEIARAEGLAGVSLRDVARKVGMQAPSLYSYFESKHAIYDAMYAQGCREFVEREAKLARTGDPIDGLKARARFFVEFSTEDPARYQLMFQRPIPGFEPSAESFAISVASLEGTRDLLVAAGFSDPAALDLMTAVATGLTDQQISNDPGGDRWTRLLDEAMDMLFDHLSKRAKQRGRARR